MEARDFVTALIDAGLTQAQIAERTGIPQPTVSKIFRGEVSDVLSRSYRKLQRLHGDVIVLPAGNDAFPLHAGPRTEGA